MIGEWNGHHAVAGQPATNLTQHDAIRQRRRGWRGRVNDGCVPVRPLERFEPRHAVKDRRGVMTADEFSPSRVANRGESEDRHSGSFTRVSVLFATLPVPTNESLTTRVTSLATTNQQPSPT